MNSHFKTIPTCEKKEVISEEKTLKKKKIININEIAIVNDVDGCHLVNSLFAGRF